MTYIYDLEIFQEPVRARMCGLGDKDRRQITPPPFIKLNIKDIDTKKTINVDSIDISTFVLIVELWSVDEKEDLTLNQNIKKGSPKSKLSVNIDGKLIDDPNKNHDDDQEIKDDDSLQDNNEVSRNIDEKQQSNVVENIEQSYEEQQPESLEDNNEDIADDKHNSNEDNSEDSEDSFQDSPEVSVPKETADNIIDGDSREKNTSPSVEPNNNYDGQYSDSKPRNSLTDGSVSDDVDRDSYSEVDYSVEEKIESSPSESNKSIPAEEQQSQLRQQDQSTEPLTQQTRQHREHHPPYEHSQHPSQSQPQLQPGVVQLNDSAVSPRSLTGINSDSDESLGDIPTRNLIGSLVVNPFKLYDDKLERGIWFILQDLSVRIEGEFKLKLTFIDIISNKTVTKFSQSFQVYSAKRFPGVVDSSPLGKVFASQGVKISIRREAKGEK